MNKLIKAAGLILALGAVSACTNPGQWGGPGGVGAGGTGGINDPSNPRSATYFQQTVGDRVLFPVDQSTLTDQARIVLASQARWLMENPEFDALIEGHADEQGTREYNLALGARRANAVHEFLVSQGVATSRLRSVSYGKERPIEICSEEICYAQNRRSVTVVTAGGLTS